MTSFSSNKAVESNKNDPADELTRETEVRSELVSFVTTTPFSCFSLSQTLQWSLCC